MYTGQVAIISNKATWDSRGTDSRGNPGAIELVDETDDSTIDLTDPTLGLVIVVTIKTEDGCTLVTGSITSGKVIITSPAFYWRFEVADLSGLCAGTYRFGVKVTINGDVDDLIDGSIVVIEGN